MSGDNWLKRFREQAGLTNEQLAEQSGLSLDRIKEWQRSPGHSKFKKTELPGNCYEKLAHALHKSSEQLREAHQQDIEEDQRIAALEKAKTAAQEAPIDVHQIMLALDACVDAQFVQSLKSELETKENTYEAAEKVAGILRDKDHQRLFKVFNPPLQDSLKASAALPSSAFGQRQQRLESLRHLVVVVAVNAMIPADEWQDGGEFTVSGDAHAWLVRLRIDRTLGYLLTETRPLDATRLDNHSTRSLLGSGATSASTVEEQLWEIVCQFHERTRPLEAAPPHPDRDVQGFRDYCQKLDDVLEQANYLEDHAFVLLMEQRDDELPLLARRLFPSLRLFRHRPGLIDESWALIKPSKLEAWLARSLHQIHSLMVSPSGSHKPSQPEEEPSMPHAPQIVINNQLNSGNHSNQNTGNDANQASAGRDANAGSGGIEAFSEKLAELLTETDPDDDAHRPLRGAVREIQAGIQSEGKPPAKGREWLAKATEGVQLGTKVAALLAQLHGLWPGI